MELLNLLNSKKSKISRIFSKFLTSNLNSLISKSIGTFVIIVANFFDRIPNSLLASIFSFIFPFKSDVFSNKFSSDPYSFKNFFAVLSPTPGNPGILSTESPFIAKKSIT